MLFINPLQKKVVLIVTHQANNKTLVMVVGVIVLTVTLLDVFVAGYIKYSVAYATCGSQPVSVVPGSFAGGTSVYDIPGSTSYSITASSVYYCSRDEAEARGIGPNPLSAEGLKRREELNNK